MIRCALSLSDINTLWALKVYEREIYLIGDIFRCFSICYGHGRAGMIGLILLPSPVQYWIRKGGRQFFLFWDQCFEYLLMLLYYYFFWWQWRHIACNNITKLVPCSSIPEQGYVENWLETNCAKMELIAVVVAFDAVGWDGGRTSEETFGCQGQLYLRWSIVKWDWMYERLEWWRYWWLDGCRCRQSEPPREAQLGRRGCRCCKRQQSSTTATDAHAGPDDATSHREHRDPDCCQQPALGRHTDRSGVNVRSIDQRHFIFLPLRSSLLMLWTHILAACIGHFLCTSTALDSIAGSPLVLESHWIEMFQNQGLENEGGLWKSLKSNWNCLVWSGKFYCIIGQLISANVTFCDIAIQLITYLCQDSWIATAIL